MNWLTRIFAPGFLFMMIFPGAIRAQSVPESRIFSSEGQNFRVETLLERKDVIWGFDFLPDGKIIFTERKGQMLVFSPGTRAVAQLTGVPGVFAQGQGGLLDVRVLADEPRAPWVYFIYSEPAENDTATTALARARLEGTNLNGLRKLFSAWKPSGNLIHFGSRIEFDGKGHVFVSVGDRNERAAVQNLEYDTGKILRLNEDGSVPADNPFVSKKGARAGVYTYGHRNPQGLARHPRTGELWSAEMGPLGGDELNLIRPGNNYGWPVITYGREYSGGRIGEGTEKPDMQQPVAHWVPSISPSGMGFYTGEAFPKWKENLFLGCLSGLQLRRLVLENGKVVRQEALLKELRLRFRNVRQGPDGYLYFSTDNGVLARLVPGPS